MERGTLKFTLALLKKLFSEIFYPEKSSQPIKLIQKAYD